MKTYIYSLLLCTSIIPFKLFSLSATDCNTVERVHALVSEMLSAVNGDISILVKIAQNLDSSGYGSYIKNYIETLERINTEARNAINKCNPDNQLNQMACLHVAKFKIVATLSTYPFAPECPSIEKAFERHCYEQTRNALYREICEIQNTQKKSQNS